MSKSLILIFLAAVLSCATSDKTTQEEKRARIFFDQGTRELQYKEYTKALTHLLKANKYDPNNSKILNNLGMAYYFKEAEKKAITLIKRSIKLDPTNSDAKTNLGTIYLRQEKLDKAEKLYIEVSKDLTYPFQFRTFYNLGIIERERGRSSKALSYFKKSVKLQSGYCPASLEVGKIQYKRQKYNEALQRFKDASFGKCYILAEPTYYQALTHIKLDQFALAKNKLEDIISRFALTRHETMARNQLRQIKKLQKREYLENQTRLFSDRKILTPDF